MGDGFRNVGIASVILIYVLLVILGPLKLITSFFIIYIMNRYWERDDIYRKRGGDRERDERLNKMDTEIRVIKELSY